MTYWRPLSALLLLALIASGCVQFQPASLYTGFEPAPETERPRKLELAVEPVIYSDQNDDTIWFQDDTNCTQGEVVSDVTHSGQRAVAVSWNRFTEGCEWAGFGVGWDNWAGKNLADILPYAAVEMQVRTQQGRMYGLPIVLTLEDYSGGMGFAYTGNGYFERYFLDEEWQSVTVPLANFDMEVENLDPTNVKQLMFELQQSGSIYVDDVKLVWYEPELLEPWIVLPERPDPTALPITLYDDTFINDDGWGLISDACQSVTKESDSDRGDVLRMAWDITPRDCYEGMVGVSWDQWYPMDLTSIRESAAVQFDVRLPSGTATQVPVRVAMEDYGRRVSQIILDARYTASGEFSTEWQTVTIPFTELRGGGRELAAAPATVGDLPEFQDGANYGAIKQFIFFLDDAGEVLIDNIRLIPAE
ncbi:MAG: glycan-binding surface protein [Bacteroidota bacterium]